MPADKEGVRRAMRSDRTSSKRRRPAEENQGGDEGSESFNDLATRIIGRQDSVLQVAKALQERDKARRQRDEWKKAYEELNAEYPEDAIALVGDEAKAVEALRERKIDLTKLHTLFEKLESDNATLTADNLKYKARDTYGEFVKTSGYNVDAVEGLVEKERLHAELGDVTVKGVDKAGKATTTTQKTLMVRKASDPKAPLVPFDDYVEKNVKWMWPALKQKAEQSTAPAPGNTGNTGNKPAPVLTVDQGSTTTGETGNPIADWRNRRNQQRAAQPNPLSFGAANTVPATGRRGVPTK